MDMNSVDIKKTVNLPRTDFSMKANLPQMEPKLLARWDTDNLYAAIRATCAGRPRYVLHDGPPYANGDLHLGHALNKLLKDFVVKSKTMAGFDSPYVPGWDCHGLPIEIKVDGQLGSRKAQMSVAEIRAECRKYAQKYVDLQRKGFIRLGVLGRWDDPYMTMAPKYQAAIARAFVDFFDQGYVYKGLKPVNWCISCRTALAEAEVEYENHSSSSIWVRFALTSDAAAIHPDLAGKQVWGLIWTTTPWTIPSNMAICYHPKLEYAAAQVGDNLYIVADGLLKDTAASCGWGEPTVIARFEGSKLEGAIFRHPFIERDSRGILGDHVTLEQGVGAVHTAPGHGADDFSVGQKYKIQTYCPVGPSGKLYHTEVEPGALPEELIGKTVWQANPVVIEILERSGALLAQKKIDHSYPHCWRCHKPTIFRATEQWFIGMDRNNLRQRALDAIRNVKWISGWGQERISNMIAARPDWCISRQRIWGVPIVAFHCNPCGKLLEDRKPLYDIVRQFEEQSVDVWYSKSAAELLGPDVKCAGCGAADFRKENDILDVWFDSGVSHLAVLTTENDLGWPSELYLEGGDQYRGWFHSSLLIGVGLKGAAPYRECATNGWTLDPQGRAMSKSAGNGIDPDDIIKQYGADILRLWVGSVEFQEDVVLSPTILTRLTEAYRKIRNTFRYTLGNLEGFDPATDAVAPADMHEIDRWILQRTADVIAKCTDFYREFAFHRVYQTLYAFTTTDLSAVYFDILKDRLYTTAPKSQARRSAQTALHRITYALVRMLAPVLAFTMDEVWGHLAKPPGAPASVHLSEFPNPAELTAGISAEDAARLANWDKLIEVRDAVLKSLEVAREKKFIGAPLEAKVIVGANGDTYPLLSQYKAELPSLLIVSQVELANHAAGPLLVTVEKAGGVKCERCWKYTMDHGVDAELPTVCGPCAAAVREIVT